MWNSTLLFSSSLLYFVYSSCNLFICVDSLIFPLCTHSLQKLFQNKCKPDLIDKKCKILVWLYSPVRKGLHCTHLMRLAVLFPPKWGILAGEWPEILWIICLKCNKILRKIVSEAVDISPNGFSIRTLKVLMFFKRTRKQKMGGSLGGVPWNFFPTSTPMETFSNETVQWHYFLTFWFCLQGWIFFHSIANPIYFDFRQPDLR